MVDSGEEGGHSKKNRVLLEVEVFFMLSIFKLKSDTKYESISSNFEGPHIYTMCLSQCLWSPLNFINITSYRDLF